VSNVVGDEATVETIMPVGADAHDFQASSQQVSLMSTADLVVAVGLGLEAGMDDAMESAESDGADVLEIAPLLNPLPFGDHTHHQGEGGDDEGGSHDPHVWMDPIRMAEAARLIGAELEEVAPGGGWAERAETYATQLTETNSEIEATLSAISEDSRIMVTNHQAFGYFAELYDFEIVGVVIPGGSTLGEPSSGELAQLVEVIDEENVPAIFTDLSSPSGLAETVAEEAERPVEVVGLYTESLGEPGSGADTLVGMLTTNAQRITDALS
jgi:zinc/manganese transport system substrate-binding protein